MHYLIDGHNLIAKMPDISLDDPNDEMKLVLRLKRWAAAGTKRRVTVIFDRGLPGGKSVRFSNRDVKVLFASSGGTADEMLIRRIRRARNPQEFTVISSDQEILSAARASRMPFRRSEAFAAVLAEEGTERKNPRMEADQPSLSAEEVAEWLDLFGPVQERAPRRPKRKKVVKKAESPVEKPTQKKPLPTAKRADRELSAAEIDAWMKLFEEGDT